MQRIEIDRTDKTKQISMLNRRESRLTKDFEEKTCK